VNLEMIVLVAIGIWIALVVLVIALCQVAKRGDDVMDAALARALAQSGSPDQTLRSLDLGHAAALLGVAPDTLLAWEARFGFPTSNPSEHRYNQSEVLALRDCIADEVSIAAAVARARERTRGRRTRTGASVADRRGGGLAS
jgi:hypothetical protein